MQLRPRRLATPVVLCVAVLALVALAVSAHGFPVQHVSLNDGGVWVTDNSAGEVGRFAKPVGQLDGELAPASASTNLDVWQDGPLVAAYDATGGRMYAVNVYDTTFAGAGTAVAPDTADGAVALGDDTLAVLGTDHALRTVTLAAGGGSLAALAATAKPLAAHLPSNSAVAVGDDDTAWVAGGGQLREFAEGAAASSATSLPFPATDPMQVTTVGNVPVVADATTKTIYLPDSGHVVPLPATDTSPSFQLQQSSEASAVVVVATGAALYSVDLSTGRLTTLSRGHSGTVAAPVQVAGCVHAAWADGEAGSYVRTCGSPPQATTAAQSFSTGDTSPQLVFRVNSGEVVLNDTANGGLFLVDTAVTNVTPVWQQTSKQSTTQVKNPDRDQLKTTPYTQGVRPGSTTVVHVLDAVQGAPGLTYAVTAVGKPDQPGVAVSVAPDAQTVLATVTSLTGDAHFQYTVDDGHGHRATGEVTLVPRTAGENSPPHLKAKYQPPALSVASGGTVVVPVIGDWRDGDGDPLYIDSGAVAASAGSSTVTSDGALSFTAPHTAADETVSVSYGVSDGRAAKPTTATLKVSVLGSSDTKYVAPTVEPDAALAEVGAPVTLWPLDNDLPGVDPTNPDARLALAAPVPAVPGATVSTDVAHGTVTFTAQRPGDFFLTYTDAYGAAPTSSGTIRVHVIPAPGTPQPPVTTPGVAVLHGQLPAVVDVLADDYDPQGWILGVTGATSATPGVYVDVIDQRWLRISADNPQPGMTATVTYSVSDGKGSAVGTVTVSAVAATLSDDQITTTGTAITVRAGDSAAVPVLAGDASSLGLPLSMAGTPPLASPPVAGLHVGIQGGDLRVDAPAGITAEEETAVSYVVTDASGATATGELDVTIEPAPSKADPDQAPVPEEVDARETAGDVAVIPVPVSGVDPDGDSVTVIGVTVPPALGRIVAVGPDSITYQSYPDSAGTDTFSYQVTDPYGLTGTAQVRVAVLPPGLPQPPVAVDDVLNAPPGASLHWNVLGNDYIPPGDTVTVEPLAKTNATVPPGVRLTGSSVYLQVPASPSDPPVEFSYGDTDGSARSLAQVIVHAVTDAKIPPIANDDVAPAPPAGAAAVTVDVLKNDDDPVGSPSDLKISWAPAGVTVNGAELTIRLAAQPREVPYQVTAPDGLTATAVVYVPGTQSSAIRLKPGTRITLAKDGSATVPLASVLIDTAGHQLKLATTAGLAASPAGDLTVSAGQATAFTARALGSYTGPGAVTVAVYDGATLQDPHGNSATITIPVQVGPDVPILRCPAAPLQLVAGGAAQSYDIGQLCHVWVDTTIAQAAPRYTVSWAKPVSGVTASVPGGTSLLLSVTGARGSATGSLTVTPVGAATGGTLNIQVTGMLPLPVGQAVSLTAQAGHGVTVDLSQYVTSPLAQPGISVLSVTHPDGASVATSGATVTITPGVTASGTLSLVARVTDEPGQADRAISVPITVTIVGRPGAPGQPTATASGNALVVSFGAAVSNGAPVEFYTVYLNEAAHQCGAPPCTITGLASGSYTVYVTATNSAGAGPESAKVTTQLNAVPGIVTGLTATPGNGQVALAWQAAQPDGVPVTGYEVEISPPPAGQPQLTAVGIATSHTFSGLADGTSYTFTVRAAGGQGDGPWSLGVTAVPLGKPATMPAPSATAAAAAGGSLAVTVSWVPAADNGSPITAYTVDEYQAASAGGPWGNPVATTTVAASAGDSMSFTVGTGGGWYEYSVGAVNAAGASAQSPLSAPAIQSVAAPPTPSGVTATAADNAVQVSFTLPGNASSVTSVEYGLNSPAESGTITFAAGAAPASFTITSAMSGAVANGTPVTVYLAACANATTCSAWAGPSNQVTPRGALANPTVTATANGTSVAYTWGATSDGLSATLTVCINAACTPYNVPAAGNYNGGSTVTGYPNGQTETITAYVTDSSGQRAPAAGTVSASATTSAPVVPVNATLAVSESATQGDEVSHVAAFVHIAMTNMLPNTVVSYTCTTNYSAGFAMGTAGATYHTDSTGATVTTDASGAASFDSAYQWLGWPDGVFSTVASVTCTSGSVSGTYTTPPPPPGIMSISEGAANPGTSGCQNCFFVHVQVSQFVITSPTLSCTTNNPTYGLVLGPVTAATVTTQTSETSNEDSAGNVVSPVGSGSGGPPTQYTWDSNIEWAGGFTAAGATLSCTVTSSTGATVSASVTG